MFKLTENKLRRLIRSVLLEQVVGYKAPTKSFDDPNAPLDDSPAGAKSDSEAVTGKPVEAPQSSDGVSSDGGGYVSVGDMGVDVSLDDSPEEKKASAMQVQKLSQQRQKDLDSGNAVDATDTGEQLSMARKMRG